MTDSVRNGVVCCEGAVNEVTVYKEVHGNGQVAHYLMDWECSGGSGRGMGGGFATGTGHTKQEAQRVLRKLWNRVESRWARAEAADRQVNRAWRNGGDRRGYGGLAGKAWKSVERLMESYDRVVRAWNSSIRPSRRGG